MICTFLIQTCYKPCQGEQCIVCWHRALVEKGPHWVAPVFFGRDLDTTLSGQACKACWWSINDLFASLTRLNQTRMALEMLELFPTQPQNFYYQGYPIGCSTIQENNFHYKFLKSFGSLNYNFPCIACTTLHSTLDKINPAKFVYIDSFEEYDREISRVWSLAHRAFVFCQGQPRVLLTVLPTKTLLQGVSSYCINLDESCPNNPIVEPRATGLLVPASQ